MDVQVYWTTLGNMSYLKCYIHVIRESASKTLLSSFASTVKTYLMQNISKLEDVCSTMLNCLISLLPPAKCQVSKFSMAVQSGYETLFCANFTQKSLTFCEDVPTSRHLEKNCGVNFWTVLEINVFTCRLLIFFSENTSANPILKHTYIHSTCSLPYQFPFIIETPVKSLKHLLNYQNSNEAWLYSLRFPLFRGCTVFSVQQQHILVNMYISAIVTNKNKSQWTNVRTNANHWR